MTLTLINVCVYEGVPLMIFARYLFRVIVGTLLIGVASWALAKPVSNTTSPVREATTDALAVDAAASLKKPSMLAAPLQAFMPDPQPLLLRGADMQASVSLPIAKRLKIRRAVLHLTASHSVSLLPGRSQLQVRLNGRVIAQLALDPRFPRLQAKIALPLEALQPGYHDLTFAVAQHYTLDCEDPSAPELWTEIDTQRSWIELDGELRSWQPGLADWHEIFDARLWGQQNLVVMSPHALDERVLRWGGLAAQAAALRLGFVPLQVTFAAAQADVAFDTGSRSSPLTFKSPILQDADAVLVGTAAALAPMLAPQWRGRITGPFLALWPAPGNAGRFVMVVSGPRDEDVDTAMQALALMRPALPQTPVATVSNVQWPPATEPARADLVLPGHVVTLAQLGVRTVSMAGRYGVVRVGLRLPADLYTPKEAKVRLRLRFAYGAALRSDSVINVHVNSRFVAAIPLNQYEGGYVRDYEIDLPLQGFRPGQNELTLSLSLVPSQTGRCELLQTDNLRLTIFEDSTLQFPEAARLATLPDLERLQRTGYPYARRAWGRQTMVSVAKADAVEVASAWMLAGKLAQVQGTPWLEAKWRFGLDALGEEPQAIVVGTLAHLPQSLKVPGAHAVQGNQATVYALPQTAADPPGQVKIGWSSLDGSPLGSMGVIAQSALPRHSSGTLTVLSAATSDLLYLRTAQLIEPGIWGQLRGSASWWDVGEQVFAHELRNDAYTVGESSLWQRLSFFLWQHSWAGIALVTLLCALLAAVTWGLLRRWRGRHNDDESQ